MQGQGWDGERACITTDHVGAVRLSPSCLLTLELSDDCWDAHGCLDQGACAQMRRRFVVCAMLKFRRIQIIMARIPSDSNTSRHAVQNMRPIDATFDIDWLSTLSRLLPDHLSFVGCSASNLANGSQSDQDEV